MRTRLAALALSLAPVLAAACASPGDVGARPGTLAVPSPLAPVDMDGARLDLDADLGAGRAVVLIWWQTWCASCRAEAPALVAAAKAHGERLRFVGIVPGTAEHVDDAEVRKVARELALPYPNVRDRDLALTGAFGIEGTPTIVVLEGSPARVVWSGHGLPPDFGAFGRAARP